MEELNKTQIVLLTLFVSFITSIATGITTVTLMDQAPPAITQTLNRVVEKTIERVIQPANVVTKEVKVVVKQEDLVVKAVEKNTPHIALVTALKNVQSDDMASAASAKEGIGFLVSSDGYVVVDRDFANTNVSSYRVRFSDGKSFDADVATTSESIALLHLRHDKAVAENKTDGQKIIDSVKQAVGIQTESPFVPVSFGDLSTVKLGQSIAALGGKMGDEVSTGIISRIEKNSGKDGVKVDGKNDKNSALADPLAKKENPTSNIHAIYTNITLGPESSGGPLIAMDGNVLGMNIVRDNGQFTVPSSMIASFLDAFTRPSPPAKS